MAIAGWANGSGWVMIPQWIMASIAVIGPVLAALLFSRLFSRWKAGLRLPDGRQLRSAGLLLIGSAPLYGLVALLAAEASGADYVRTDFQAMALGFAIQIVFVALLEELGWRGYLTHVLLAKTSPFLASCIVGFAWFLWHLPKFMIGLDFTMALGFACIANSIVATLILHRMGLISCIVLHASFNLALIVLDTGQSAYAAQIAAFQGVTMTSVVIAIICLVAERRWFFGLVRR